MFEKNNSDYDVETPEQTHKRSFCICVMHSFVVAFSNLLQPKGGQCSTIRLFYYRLILSGLTAHRTSSSRVKCVIMFNVVPESEPVPNRHAFSVQCKTTVNTIECSV